MAELNSKEYYASRERRERVLADQAQDPKIAAIHREMADRYAGLTVEAGYEGQPRPILVANG